MWLNIRTGYNLKATFGHLEEIISKCDGYAGIADPNSTFGHVKFAKECEKQNVIPIFGVRLAVSDLNPIGLRTPRYENNEMTFIATSQDSLQELYQLIDRAYQQFYYFPKITYEQLNSTSEELIVLSGIAPVIGKIKRKIYLQLSPDLPKNLFSLVKDFEAVACIDNWYPRKKDKEAYESFAAGMFEMERKTTPMHILSKKEWFECFPELDEKVLNAAWNKKEELAVKACGVELPKAPMIVFDEKENPNKLLKRKCKIGAKKKEISLDGGKYAKRLKRELEIVKQKGFADYFLVVSDLVEYAKKEMVVGPGRGSAAGSLICFLIGITEVDPLKYGLLFERFIDINRSDWPDIDIDFQDTKRDLVIKRLQYLYGSQCVAQIGNINKLKPKSVITRVAKALHIPLFKIEEFKDSIEDRPDGDKRARFAIEDAIKETQLGKMFAKEFPNMVHVARIEGHPSHSGVHAAGIIVCQKPINRYCGINSKEQGKRIAMIDLKDAETLNLLKIDALGLKTLNILAEICDMIKKPYSWIYEIPLDDKKTYKYINKGSLDGIFQMEGETLKELSKKMKVKNILDLAALSAICRPGPLISGAAHKFVKQQSGQQKTLYLSQHQSIIDSTKETYGNVIYQEQLMVIVKEFAGLSWEDVIKIRKLMGKSQGDEAFKAYKDKFIKGAIENGSKKDEAKHVWESLENFGQYGFNKSHAVSYAIITYLTAYFKANHKLEFAVATLNNTSKNSTALRILRELDKEGIKYVPFHKDISKEKWTVYNDKLYGGLTTIDGIGSKGAQNIIKCRESGKELTPGLQKLLNIGKTPFKYLYPASTLYGEYYKKSSPYGKATTIEKVDKQGKEYVIIGMLTKKTIKDLNEKSFVVKRQGEVLDGPTAFLNFVLEDDTGQINVSISRYDFEDLHEIVTEESIINEDWFVVFGKLGNNPKYRCLYVKDVRKITKN